MSPELDCLLRTRFAGRLVAAAAASAAAVAGPVADDKLVPGDFLTERRGLFFPSFDPVVAAVGAPPVAASGSKSLKEVDGRKDPMPSPEPIPVIPRRVRLLKEFCRVPVAEVLPTSVDSKKVAAKRFDISPLEASAAPLEATVLAATAAVEAAAPGGPLEVEVRVPELPPAAGASARIMSSPKKSPENISPEVTSSDPMPQKLGQSEGSGAVVVVAEDGTGSGVGAGEAGMLVGIVVGTTASIIFSTSIIEKVGEF